MNVKIVDGYDYPEEVRALFSEYTDMLIANDAEFKKYLAVQNYDEEIAHLKSKYGLPEGRLYVLFADGKSAGCIGLRKIDSKTCEMKQQYIRSAWRGKKLGETLVEKIITEAREIGYSYMVLDTLPFLQNAIRLYKKIGFYEIENYNDSPLDTSIYMKLDL